LNTPTLRLPGSKVALRTRLVPVAINYDPALDSSLAFLLNLPFLLFQCRVALRYGFAAIKAG